MPTKSKTNENKPKKLRYTKSTKKFNNERVSIVNINCRSLKDKKKILPCAAYLQGEYGIQDLFIGVPVKLGAEGIEEIIEITLTEEEQQALQKSAEAVQELKNLLKTLK